MYPRSLKNFLILKKKYRIFTALICGIIIFSFIFAGVITWQSYVKYSLKKYELLAESLANNLQSYFDNIHSQSEFLAHKVIISKGNSEFIHKILDYHFSFGIDLENDLNASWIGLKWYDKNDIVKKTKKDKLLTSLNDKSYSFNPKFDKSWQINFMHNYSIKNNKKYIPITFGITNSDGGYEGFFYGDIYIPAVINYLKRDGALKNLDIILLDQDKKIISSSVININSHFFNNLNHIIGESSIIDTE